MSYALTIHLNGFVFLPSYRPFSDTIDVAAELGRPIRLGPGPPVHDLFPRTRDETTENTYSGLYGLDAFPFHTDFAHWAEPPRYFLLRAIIGYPDVPTILVDSRLILEDVGMRPLHRAFVKPRRRRRNVATPLLRLYEKRDGYDSLVRWDDVFICPGSRAGAIGSDLFAKSLACAEPIRIPLVDKGDTLIIDNWRMLHARAPVSEHRRDRLLHRAYLEHVH